MNVETLKQISVILTLFATTQSDPTSVAVLLDIRVMVETAEVNNCYICFVECLNTAVLKIIAVFITLLSVDWLRQRTFFLN